MRLLRMCALRRGVSLITDAVTPPSSQLPLPADLDPEEDAARLLAHLRTQIDGLDEREAARRLQQVGPNEIRRESGPRWWRTALAQFTHPLALLLWVAAALSIVTGVIALAIAIVVVIVLNAGFAFAQERQAEHATEALRDLLPTRARVRRGGRAGRDRRDRARARATCCCSPRATGCRPTRG